MKRATTARSCVVVYSGRDSRKLHPPDTVIEDRQNPSIRLRADQASEALLQRQHGLRHLVFRECVASILFQRPDARRHDRVARHRERQFIDDHA